MYIISLRNIIAAFTPTLIIITHVTDDSSIKQETLINIHPVGTNEVRYRTIAVKRNAHRNSELAVAIVQQSDDR